jgi:hypothetical protein
MIWIWFECVPHRAHMLGAWALVQWCEKWSLVGGHCRCYPQRDWVVVKSKANFLPALWLPVLLGDLSLSHTIHHDVMWPVGPSPEAKLDGDTWSYTSRFQNYELNKTLYKLLSLKYFVVAMEKCSNTWGPVWRAADSDWDVQAETYKTSSS